MKNLYILLLVLIVSGTSFGQTRSLNRFINHQKVYDHALAISVPGWMLDIASFGAKYLDDEEDEVKELIKFSDNVRKIRILIIEEQAKVDPKDVNKLIKGLKREKFEELITVRSEDAKVQLMVREKNDAIRNLTAFIQADDSLVLVTLAGKFKYDDIRNLSFWDDVEIDSDILKEL